MLAEIIRHLELPTHVFSDKDTPQFIALNNAQPYRATELPTGSDMAADAVYMALGILGVRPICRGKPTSIIGRVIAPYTALTTGDFELAKAPVYTMVGDLNEHHQMLLAAGLNRDEYLFATYGGNTAGYVSPEKRGRG